MRYSTIVVAAASLFAGLASAQSNSQSSSSSSNSSSSSSSTSSGGGSSNSSSSSSSSGSNLNTPIPCCTVPANRIPQDQRSDWCSAQQNTCVDLCGGQAKISSNGNSCDGTTLQYTCKCSNGTNLDDPIMKQYEQTVPGQMCRYWFGVCINATNQNSAAQFQCEAARNSQCGNLTTKAFGSKSSGASGSGGAGSTASRSGSSPASTGTSGSAPSSGAAALAHYATPALAGGLLAVFGLAL